MLARTADGGRWGGALGPLTGTGPCGPGPGGPVVMPRGHPGQTGTPAAEPLAVVWRGRVLVMAFHHQSQ